MASRLFFVCMAALCIAAATAQAQSKKVIQLEPEIINIPDRHFYIKKVVDDRETEGMGLGTVYTGLLGKSRELVILGGVQQGLTKYLQQSLPRMEDDVPVLMIVERFSIEEQKGLGERGETRLKVKFTADGLSTYSTEARFDYNTSNPTQNYEEILKRTLRTALESYAEDRPKPQPE
jgi:hypothetical protein